MRGIIDAIYFKLSTAYLRNEQPRAANLMGMLVDEAKNDIVIEAELGPKHFRRFQVMREGIRSGDFRRLHGGGYGAPEIDPWAPVVEPSGDELKFCDDLFRDRAVLLAMLDVPPKSTMIPQFDLAPYGRCDFVVNDDRTRYAIEVKMGDCPRSAIAQINGYITALELDMCRGTHDEVVPYVMAESFPQCVGAELARSGVRMILHSGKANELRPMAV